MRLLSAWSVVAVAFFLTGFNGLVFEILWIRLLGAIFGTTIYGTSTTLAAFLGGLGIGAFMIGRWIDRRALTFRALLLVFAACEVTAGILGLALCLALPRLQALGALGEDLTPALLFVRAMATFALVFLPSFFMGGSLPILSKAFLTVSPRPGRTVGFLYVLNTLGAGAGAILVDSWLVMHLGLMRTALAAAAGNVLAAALVVITLRGLGPAEQAARKRGKAEATGKANRVESPGAPPRTGKLTERSLFIALYGVSGFCALGYEVAWTRILLNEIFSSRFAISTMLAVVLIGLVAGGAIMSALLPPRRALIPVLAVLQALIGLSALAGLAALESWGPALRQIADRWTTRAIAFDPAGINLLGVADCLPLVIVLQGLPSLLLGAVLPLVAEGTVAASQRAGGDVGHLYLGNTIGAITGALIVGFVLLPLLSAGKTLQVLAGLNVLTAIFLAVTVPGRGRKLTGLVFGAGAAALVVLAPAPGYMQRREERTRQSFEPTLEGRTLVLHEDIYETLAIREYRLQGIPVDWRLITNSYSMSGVNMIGNRYMRLMAHIPLLLLPDAPSSRDVALICFGVGNTARAIAAHPVGRIDVIEISPGVLEVAPHLRMANEGVLDDPRVSVHVNDGRNYLLGTDERYGLITFEPPPPGQADIVGLYTREYYELVRDRLTPDGCMTQWLPIIQVTHGADLSMIKSALDVFPYVSLWTGIFDELIICGSLKPMAMDAAAITQRIRDRHLESELAEIGIEDAAGLLATFLADEKVLREWTSEVLPVTDDNRLLEYEYARKGRFSSHIQDYHLFYQSGQYVSGIDQAEQDNVRRMSVWRLDQMMGALRDPDFPAALFDMTERENPLYLADVMLGLPRAAQGVADDPAALRALAEKPALLEDAFWHCLLQRRYHDAAQVVQARLDRWPAEERYVQMRNFAMHLAERPANRAP